MNKLVGLNELAELSDSLKKEGKRLVHCHGVFDLLHPGHIIHLEEARGLGDVLFVSLTASPYVNKGPGRPYFNDSERLRTMAALGCVDYVILSEAKTPMDIIASLQPDVYVKGREYSVAEDDVTGNIDVEAEEVKKYGGRVHFTGGIVYSSTKLLNNNFPVIDPPVREHMLGFIEKYSFTDIRNIVDQMCSMRVLVIGDVIIDEYVMCGVQGLTSKDLAYSARYQKEERYPGGSLAIARHAAEFSCNVCLSSLVGGEAHLNSFIEDTLADCLKLDVFSDPEVKTTVKRRYLTQRGMRNEFEKIFSVNYIDEKAERTSHVRHGFMKWLEENLEQFDLVLLADYGHGLVDKEMMDLIQDKAKYLALNCQTNSSNLGTNLITKYRRADIITLDERELKMAMSRVSEEEKVMMEVLVSQLDCELGWLTKGAAGSWCVGKNTTYYNHPALTRTVQDTVGAGDAFFVLACMVIRAGGNVEIASFLANIAGALAATTLGNAKSVRKDELLKFAATLMKQ